MSTIYEWLEYAYKSSTSAADVRASWEAFHHRKESPVSNPHSMKNLSQSEVDAIYRILRDRKIRDYEQEFAMTSSDFLRQWDADANELQARLGNIAGRDVAFDTNHWARLLSREAPQDIVEPPIDEFDTRPVDTSGNESGV